jgi:hypothetical protein
MKLFPLLVICLFTLAVCQETPLKSAERSLDSVLIYSPIIVADVTPDVAQGYYEMHKIRKANDSLTKAYATKQISEVNCFVDSLRLAQIKTSKPYKDPGLVVLSMRTKFQADFPGVIIFLSEVN